MSENNRSVFEGTEGADSIFGTTGDDQINGYGGADTLDGGAGHDQVFGGDGNDLFYFGNGADTLSGGTGGDFFVKIGTGATVIDGGTGGDEILGDRVVYQFATQSVTIDFSTGINGGAAADDTFINIESVSGTRYGDVFVGGDGDEFFDGYSGLDTFIGSLGNDTLRGGDNTYRDIVDYSGSDASVYVDLASTYGYGGFAEGDRLIKIDHVIGSDFADTLYGDSDANILEGGDGHDTFYNVGAGDSLYGGSGTDFFIKEGPGTIYVDGGEGGETYLGDRVLYSGADASVTIDFNSGVHGGAATGDIFVNIEEVSGSRFDDTFIGGDGDEFFDGRNGLDTFIGSLGNDTLRGGDNIHKDIVDYSGSNAGVDANLATTYGSGGYAEGDRLVKIDHVIGSEFADTLTGDSSDNILEGGSGNDLFFTTGGNDSLYGGSGSDFFIKQSSDAIYVDGGDGEETYQGDRVVYNQVDEAVTVDLFGGLHEGGAAGDILINVEEVSGTAYDDILVGGNGNELLDGYIGNDFIYGSLGNDTLRGGGFDADDTVTYIGSTEGVHVDLSTTYGSGGDAEGDRIFNIEHVIGSFWNDTLVSDQDDNTFEGSSGDDIFVFHTNNGNDTIVDFRTGSEVIDLSSTDLMFLDLSVEQIGTDALVTLGDTGGTILLEGLGDQQLTESNFLFAEVADPYSYIYG